MNYFILTLDTQIPSLPSIVIDADINYTQTQIATLTITSVDTDIIDMKIWGDVDNSYDPQIQDTESNSSWISFTTSKQIKLSPGTTKTIYIRLRDDVLNISNIASDSITLGSLALKLVISESISNVLTSESIANVLTIEKIMLLEVTNE